MTQILSNVKDVDYERMKDFLLESFFSHICEEKLLNQNELNKIHKCSIAIKAFDLVSIAMSYLAINNYRQGARYYQTISLLNDAKYLANSSESLLAQKINVFSSGLIEYYEKNIEVALNLIKASLYIKINTENKFDDAIDSVVIYVMQTTPKFACSGILEVFDRSLLGI